MSAGHDEFERLINDLKKVSGNGVPAVLMHFDERLTRLEDAVNELLDEEDL